MTVKYTKANVRRVYCDVCGVRLMPAALGPDQALHVCPECAPSQTNEPNVWVGEVK